MTTYAKQETDYYCGPAVVQMALARIGLASTQTELAGELATSAQTGTTADAIVSLLAAKGLAPQRRNGAAVADIQEALAQSKAAIVGYIEKEGEPHYALVTDIADNSVVLCDPFWGERHILTLAEFEERWRDLPPGVYGDRLLITV